MINVILNGCNGKMGQVITALAKDNENILLRGSGTYYYFLSQRIHDENTREDITTKEMIYEWLNNNMDFFSKSLIAINNTSDIL